MMQNQTFNGGTGKSRDPYIGQLLSQKFHTLMDNYQKRNLQPQLPENKTIQDIYNNPKQKLHYLAVIASGKDETLAKEAKDLLCLMQGRGLTIPDPKNKSQPKHYKFYHVILDCHLDPKTAKVSRHEKVKINDEYFTIDQLKNRSATADPVIIRNENGSITIIGFNDYTWEATTINTRQQIRNVADGYDTFLPKFIISDQDLDKHLSGNAYRKAVYRKWLTEAHGVGTVPLPSMSGVNYQYEAKLMFELGQHGSHIIPFYLHSLEKDHKALRERIEKHPEDFTTWWRSLHDPDSETLTTSLQNLFQLNHHELDEIAYKLDSDKDFFSKFSDSALLALALCANKPAPKQEEIDERNKKQKNAYQQIYKADFYLNSIRHPEKLNAREKYLYCDFLYKKAIRYDASQKDKLNALKGILSCLPDNTNRENSLAPDSDINKKADELVKKLYPDDTSTDIQAIKIKVSKQLVTIKSAKTADASTTENEWMSMLKQMFVNLLYNIGIVGWRFTLESNTTISSASRQSSNFSGKNHFLNEDKSASNTNNIETPPMPPQQLTNTIQ